MAQTHSIPVWRDLYTRDPEKAVAFYTRFFGWTTEVFPMGDLGDYTMFKNGDRPFGGLEALKPGDTRPAGWHVYFNVDDVNRAAEAAAALGGEVILPPTDIPTVGRYAIVADPAGVASCPFKGQEEGEPPAESAAGDVCWEEIVAPAAENLPAFYEKLYGWEAATNDMGGAPYTVFGNGGTMVVGMCAPQPGDDDAPYWLSYVIVDDVDEAAAKGEALGGRVVLQPMDIQGVGRVAVLLDPDGHRIGLWTRN